MIRTRPGRGPSRRGATLPLVAISLTVLIGMMALTVDLGRVALNRTQLQGAADAAALAGASALGTDNLLATLNTGQTTDIATARARAQTVAQSNPIDLNPGSRVKLNLPGDVDVGLLTNPSDQSQAFLTTGVVPFNSVRVRTYADATHSGAVPFLFAPVLGQKSSTPQATAVATVEFHAIASMTTPTGNSPILPITMSISDWQKMTAGLTGLDSWTVNNATGAVSSGPDGIQEQQLYPGSNGTSSNNGLIQFGTSSHSNSVLSGAITAGPTASDVLNQWPGGNGAAASAPPWSGNPPSFPIGADPGFRSSDLKALDASMYAPYNNPVRVIPINDGTSPGNGANGTYTIVAFAAVRVVNSGWKSGNAMVQPAAISDPSLVASPTPLPRSQQGQGGIPVVRLVR